MKPGWKTTEFWMAVGVQLVGLGVATGLITPDQATALNTGIAQTIAGVAQIVGGVMIVVSAVGYAVSRAIAKLKD